MSDYSKPNSTIKSENVSDSTVLLKNYALIFMIHRVTSLCMMSRLHILHPNQIGLHHPHKNLLCSTPSNLSQSRSKKRSVFLIFQKNQHMVEELMSISKDTTNSYSRKVKLDIIEIITCNYALKFKLDTNFVITSELPLSNK